KARKDERHEKEENEPQRHRGHREKNHRERQRVFQRGVKRQGRNSPTSSVFLSLCSLCLCGSFSSFSGCEKGTGAKRGQAPFVLFAPVGRVRVGCVERYLSGAAPLFNRSETHHAPSGASRSGSKGCSASSRYRSTHPTRTTSAPPPDRAQWPRR